MKSTGLIITVLLLGAVIVGAGILFWKFYYSDIKELELELGKTTISNVEWTTISGNIIPNKVTFTKTIMAKNPNPFPVGVSKARYEIYVNMNHITDGEIYDRYTIPESGSRLIPVKFSIDWISAIAYMKEHTKAMVPGVENNTIIMQFYLDMYSSAPFKRTKVSHKSWEREIEVITPYDLTQGVLERMKPSELLFNFTKIGDRTIIQPYHPNPRIQELLYPRIKMLETPKVNITVPKFNVTVLKTPKFNITISTLPMPNITQILDVG